MNGRDIYLFLTAPIFLSLTGYVTWDFLLPLVIEFVHEK